jgi:hypothetical protein
MAAIPLSSSKYRPLCLACFRASISSSKILSLRVLECECECSSRGGLLLFVVACLLMTAWFSGMMSSLTEVVGAGGMVNERYMRDLRKACSMSSCEHQTTEHIQHRNFIVLVFYLSSFMCTFAKLLVSKINRPGRRRCFDSFRRTDSSRFEIDKV